MNPFEQNQQTPELGFNLQEFLHAAYSKLWLVALCFLTIVFVGLLYISTATPIYEATATIQVEQSEQKVVKIEDISSEDLKATEILKTMENNLQRRSLLKRTAWNLKLREHKSFASLIEAHPEEKPHDVVVAYLQENISVKLRRGTRLIDVSVQLPDRYLAKEIANRLVDEFIKETSETRSGTSESAQEFLVNEANRLKEKLSNSELALQKYNTVIQLKERIVEQKKEIDALSQRYLEKHPKMIQAVDLLKELQSEFLSEMKKIPSESTAENPMADEELSDDEKFKVELSRAESHFNVLTRDVETDRALYESILQRLKETNVTKEIDPVQIRIVEKAFVPSEPIKPKKLIIMALSVIAGGFFSVLAVLLIHTMDNSLKTVDAAEQYLDLPVLGAIPEIKADDVLKVNPATPQGLRFRFGQIFASLSFKKDDLAPTFGEALADFSDSLRQNFRSSLNLPMESWEGPKTMEGSDASHPLVLIQTPESTTSEAIRTLRVNLSLLGKEDVLRSYLFTSAVPYEGKSFTTANFAVALAQQNFRTLLIDADLRKPTIQDYFGKQKGWPGVTDYLLGKKKLSDATLSTSLPHLQLLTAGTPCPNPAELLATKAFDELLEEASKSFDRIVIDSAPVSPVADTLMIANKIQHVCLVIQAFRTPKRPAKRAIMLLESSKAHVAGIVLNRLPAASGFGYDPYYYHYHRSEGYGSAYGKNYHI